MIHVEDCKASLGQVMIKAKGLASLAGVLQGMPANASENIATCYWTSGKVSSESDVLSDAMRALDALADAVRPHCWHLVCQVGIVGKGMRHANASA